MKTLSMIVLAGALAIGAAGCVNSDSNMSHMPRDKQAETLYKTAENRLWNDNTSINEMSRAAYKLQLQVIENNNRLLSGRGKSIDIAQYVKEAEKEYADGNGVLQTYSENYSLSKASYHLSQAILIQQEALMR